MRDKSVEFCEHAFPLKYADSSDQLGMTLRDYFAAVALQGLIASGNHGMTQKDKAINAYVFADHMLEARGKL